MIMPYGQDDYYMNDYEDYGEKWDNFFLKKMLDKRKAKRAANPNVIARKEKKAIKKGKPVFSPPPPPPPLKLSTTAPTLKSVVKMGAEKMPPAVSTDTEKQTTTIGEENNNNEPNEQTPGKGFSKKHVYAGVSVFILLSFMVTAAIWAKGGHGSPQAQLKPAA